MDGILGRVVAVILGLLALAGLGAVVLSAFGNNKASTITTDKRPARQQLPEELARAVCHTQRVFC
jgi:hypothetical protein